MLENVIDLRDQKFLKSFLSCINDIPEPTELNKISKAHGWREGYPIRTLESLEKSLLTPNYTLEGITHGLPSNAQRFGYHCYKNGVQAIIYPSVRSKSGYNIAVFIDNLLNSNVSYVKLYDEVKYVSPDRQIINKSNIESFKKAEVL